MKNNRLPYIKLMVVGLFFLSGCSVQKLHTDTPVSTAIELQNFIKAGNYEAFNDLFTEERQNVISKDQFVEMEDIITDSAAYSHYELIKFTNGEMLLVLMTQEKENGKYKVEDVFPVSEDMKKIFEKP